MKTAPAPFPPWAAASDAPGETSLPAAEVTTPDECVAYVNRVGLCAWRRLPRLPAAFPTLEGVTPWADTGDVHLHTWFWKDDLHIERRLFYGMLLAGGTPVFVSLAFLPLLIAAQGDNDARTLYEQGRLPQNALLVYEHVVRNGPTATNRLPWPAGSRHLYLTELQRRFLLTKHGLTGRTRGTYGYVWGECQSLFPDAFRQAAQMSVADARQTVLGHFAAQNVELTPAAAARLFRWTEDAA